jgi:hypothetical protein
MARFTTSTLQAAPCCALPRGLEGVDVTTLACSWDRSGRSSQSPKTSIGRCCPFIHVPPPSSTIQKGHCFVAPCTSFCLFTNS